MLNADIFFLKYVGFISYTSLEERQEEKMTKVFVIMCAAAICAFSGAVQAIPNPWTDCGSDFQCGAEKAGFEFPLKLENYTVRAMNDMMEIRFLLDEDRAVTVRKSTMPKGEPDDNGIIDISGDYNKYPINKTITLENGVNFSVRGDENSYKVVNFAAETGYYSITCAKGLSLKDIEYFYKLLEEAEAPR